MLNADGSPTTALDPSSRFNLAYLLAKEGFFIDSWIDAYGSDPYLTNYSRIQEGVLTITSAIGSAGPKRSASTRQTIRPLIRRHLRHKN